MCSDRARANGFKLEGNMSGLDVRKKFLSLRMVRHCRGLSRDAVGASSLEMFRTRLDGASRQPDLAEGVLALGRAGMELDDLSLASQIILYFYISKRTNSLFTVEGDLSSSSWSADQCDYSCSTSRKLILS